MFGGQPKENFDPRSPVQPGRSVLPYFVVAFLAGLFIWTGQQYLIADSNSQKSPSTSLKPEASRVTGPAASKGDIRAVFSADDYPVSAQRNGEQGTVQAQLTVDGSGRVADCKVIRSSGSESLDSATCNILQHRARFIPARDAQGKTVASTVVTPPIKWQLEG